MEIVSNKPTITRKDLEKVLDCLINDQLITGAPIKNFESHVANLTELKYSLATNSITSAYHLIFEALQIDDKSEVIIPSFFNQAPLSALHITKGKAILIDNMKNSLFPSPKQIKEMITERTKAVVVGHTFGYHFDLDALADIEIPIIEDISHAIGTFYNDKPVGRKSDFAVVSFAPTMIVTTGNGGMMLTNNSKYYSIMRDLRGTKNERINFEYSMIDFQGAMGISQILKLQELVNRRRTIAKLYHDALRITPHKTLLPYSDNFAYQSFPVVFEAPSEKIARYWKKNGIKIVRPIEYPLHYLLGKNKQDYRNSDRLSKKIYTIPLYPTLTKIEIEKISRSLSNFI